MFKAKYNGDAWYQAADAAACGVPFQFGLQSANSIDPTKVRDALANLNVTTFYGPIKFSANGENNAKPMATIQIQSGHVVTVFPSDVAPASLQSPTPPFGQR